jgi:predicted DsbA family dithiol-disulfide isomerase
MHANANNEAVALECSANLGGNEVFWKYLDEVIEITVTPEKSANILTNTAKSLGINEKDFAKCLSNKEVQDKVLAQSQEAQSLGAKGTPFSVAISKSGKQLAIPGAYPTEEMVKIIDGLLK